MQRKIGMTLAVIGFVWLSATIFLLARGTRLQEETRTTQHTNVPAVALLPIGIILTFAGVLVYCNSKKS